MTTTWEIHRTDQDVMARAIRVVPGRGFLTPRRASICLYATRTFSSRCPNTAAIEIGRTAALHSHRVNIFAVCQTQSFRAEQPIAKIHALPKTVRATSLHQARCYATQKDGLGQSETFREYRIRQDIEQRRRVLRQLEVDALSSDVEVNDMRLQLDRHQLEHL